MSSYNKEKTSGSYLTGERFAKRLKSRQWSAGNLWIGTKISVNLRHPKIEGKKHRQQSHQQRAENRPGAVEDGIFAPMREHDKDRRRPQDVTLDTLGRSTTERNHQHRNAKPGQRGIIFQAGDTGHNADGQANKF